MITLQTQRLLLRGFREDDLDAWAAVCADAEVMRYMGDGRTLTRDEAWRQMAFTHGHWAMRGYGMWAMEDRGTGELVGRVGFLNPEGWPAFELMWMLARPHWGKGYATEGAKRALEFAFDELGRDRVNSFIRPANAPSIKLAERLGETLEGEIELLGSKALVYGLRRT